MSNGESPGFFGRLWNGIKKVLCTLVCAWKEILIWLLVMILTIVLFYYMATLVIAFVTEFLLTSPAGPAAWIPNIIISIIILIIIIVILVVIAFLISYTWEKMVQKILQCWQVC